MDVPTLDKKMMMVIRATSPACTERSNTQKGTLAGRRAHDTRVVTYTWGYKGKFVFKTERRIGPKHENSPFTILWNKMHNDIQFSDDIFMFKNEIAKQYTVFRG